MFLVALELIGADPRFISKISESNVSIPLTTRAPVFLSLFARREHSRYKNGLK